jgi:hypothetical protein
VTYTYDLSTTIGRMRLLIPDRIEDNAVFSDEELTAFLAMEEGYKRATALALETIATDEALVLKVMKVTDVQTDGAKLAAELRSRAKGLRDQADLDEARDVDDPAFDWAEQVNNQFSFRERIIKQRQRRGV